MIAALWLGWSFYKGWSNDRIEATAHSLIGQQSELNGYPIEASVDSFGPDIIGFVTMQDEDALFLRVVIERAADKGDEYCDAEQAQRVHIRFPQPHQLLTRSRRALGC